MWNVLPYGTVSKNGATIYDLAGMTNDELYYRWNDLFNGRYTVDGALGQNGGAVCSTLAAYATTVSNMGHVEPKRYSHTATAAAINAAWNKIKSECNNNEGMFASLVGFFSGTDICAHAATQFVNVIVGSGSGYLTDEAWKTVRDTASSQATSASPDCIGGWNGCAVTGTGASPWAWGGANMVQWSGAGSVYGCWEI